MTSFTLPTISDLHDTALTARLQHVLDHKTKPLGSLGQLEALALHIGQVLGTSPDTTIELNLRYRNTAVSELAFTPRRHMLVTYNTLPHLDAAPYRVWVTYA